MISWHEDRCLAVEDALLFLAASQDAGSEPALRPYAGGAWLSPDIPATRQAVDVFDRYAAYADDDQWRQRAQRMAGWLGHLPGDSSASPTSEDLRLFDLANQLPSPWVAPGESVKDEFTTRVMAREIVSMLKSGRATPGSPSAAAVERVAAWLLDRFEVDARLEPSYPRLRRGTPQWAPVETLARIAEAWFILFERSGDGWFLNSALHLVDNLRAEQNRGIRNAVLSGALPSSFRSTSTVGTDGDASATVAYVSALIAEEHALSKQADRHWQTAATS